MSDLFVALGSISGILTAFYGIFKLVAWSLTKTPDQINQDIDAQELLNKEKAKETGRPE